MTSTHTPRGASDNVTDPALHGIRVLDLSNLGAGPMITMHLGDFGADVIKVEHPIRGDELRHWGNAKDGVGLFFKVVNRNKRAVTLDLKTPEGQELARALARECDVVVENYRTGTIEGWGLGYSDLSADREDLVYAHVTGFGRTGPRSHQPGFGSLTEAFAGAVYRSGFPDRRPLMQPFALVDSAAALVGAYAVMVALFHRERTGQGQEIDLALYESIFNMMGPHVIDYDQLGLVQERMGAHSPHVAPRGTFQTRDGAWVAMSGSTQSTFERICAALGAPELATDARFATNAARISHLPDLTEALDDLAGAMDRDVLLERADELGAPICAVNNIADIFEDDHYDARSNIVKVDDEELGSVRMQNVATTLTSTPGAITHAGPRLGQHNAEVYRGLLGLDREHVQRLRDKHVI